MPPIKSRSDGSSTSPQPVRRSIRADPDSTQTNPAISKHGTTPEANLLAAIDEAHGVEVASEAIVVLDIVQSTVATNLFGWHAVGRVVTRDLRRLAYQTCVPLGLASAQTTGDGLLLTFSDPESAEMAVPAAIAGMRTLLARIGERNALAPEHLRFDVRVAVHFGEVDVVGNDREGPNVAFAFRLENVSRSSLPSAMNPIKSRSFPSENYVICSEAVACVLERVGDFSPRKSCGLFRMKGFPGWWEVFLLGAHPLPARCRGHD